MAKTPKKGRKLTKYLKKYSLPFILFTVLIVLIILTYQVILADKFSLFSFVGDTNVSLLTPTQAMQAFEGKFNQRINSKLQFDQNFTIDLATSSAKINYSPLTLAFNNQHPNSFWQRINSEFKNIVFSTKINPQISFSLDGQIDQIASSIDKQPKNAQLIFNEIPSTSSANIQIKEGENGKLLDKEALKQQIINFLLTNKLDATLPLKTTSPKITTKQVSVFKDVLEGALKEPIKLTFEQNSWTIDAKQLLTLLDLTQGSSILDEAQTKSYLKTISSEIDQDVQEGLFEFNTQTKRVTAFKPSQVGRKLDLDKTFNLLNDLLANNSSKIITLPVEVVKPKVQTQDVNSLGIKELIGRGISNFAGSIPNRIYNVNLTATKINGVLIPPGEIFSFNQTVGDITAATGFKQAYVIKEGRTVLDDGGGVCQDSTTLFRAVLNAGLPVIARTAHAYRVGYYEQGFPPGLDATIFYPSVDFQFKNDSANYILIQAYTEGLTLYIDLYGTSDGRIANISTPIVTNIIPAPPDLRQDDPTLPKGIVKQVDFAARGATVNFKRTVVRNGETIISENWRSVYKPWQAIYLIGTL